MVLQGGQVLDRRTLPLPLWEPVLPLLPSPKRLARKGFPEKVPLPSQKTRQTGLKNARKRKTTTPNSRKKKMTKWLNWLASTEIGQAVDEYAKLFWSILWVLIETLTFKSLTWPSVILRWPQKGWVSPKWALGLKRTKRSCNVPTIQLWPTLPTVYSFK